jgi:hypothetical protein
MSKHPVKIDKRAVRVADRDEIEGIERVPAANPFFSFRYSYTEISARSDKAHMKARNTRFEDGKLTSEAFEGDLGRPLYDQLVSDAQHYFLGQTALFLKSLALLLPFSRKPPPGRD